jgi:iron-sulfur cluster assembly protein
MLTITPQASAAIVSLLGSPSVPEGAGLRLMHAPAEDGAIGIGLAVVEHPDADDQVIETVPGAGLFVEAETAELLDDKELDADIDSDRVTFSLRPQSLNGGPGAD